MSATPKRLRFWQFTIRQFLVLLALVALLAVLLRTWYSTSGHFDP
jgi:hypothetical protein